MKRVARFVAPFVCAAVVVVGMTVGSARGGTTLTYEFTGCTSPAPSSFDAVRIDQSSGSGFRLTSGEAIFVVLVFRDLTTNTEFNPPGVAVSGVATVTCTVISPISGDTLEYSGFLRPLG